MSVSSSRSNASLLELAWRAMPKRYYRIILIVLTVACGLSALVTAPIVLLTAAMGFDAPGSEYQVWAWIVFIVVLSIPLWFVIGAIVVGFSTCTVGCERPCSSLARRSPGRQSGGCCSNPYSRHPTLEQSYGCQIAPAHCMRPDTGTAFSACGASDFGGLMPRYFFHTHNGVTVLDVEVWSFPTFGPHATKPFGPAARCFGRSRHSSTMGTQPEGKGKKLLTLTVSAENW
jgi:hypothetical protein